MLLKKSVNNIAPLVFARKPSGSPKMRATGLLGESRAESCMATDATMSLLTGCRSSEVSAASKGGRDLRATEYMPLRARSCLHLQAAP